MDEVISRQVLDLWNRYKPTIAVDAIEYDMELKKLLGTNLAEVGTDCISRQKAINALYEWECDNKDDRDAIDVINGLPPIQPEIIHCKDCDWWTRQKDSLQGRCALTGSYPTGEWYCGNARKSEG